MGQDGLSNAVSLTVLLFHPVTLFVREKACLGVLKIPVCIKKGQKSTVRKEITLPLMPTELEIP